MPRRCREVEKNSPSLPVHSSCVFTPVTATRVCAMAMAHLRTLFLFHTGSYNSSGALNDSVWREYPWDYVHTVLLYSPHPELTAHARSVGANVALSLGAPKDLENGTARQAIIQTAIHNCAGANGCNSLNLDVERSIANDPSTDRRSIDET